MKKIAFILSIIFNLTISTTADKLKGVAAIVNHGDTIPSKFYPRDPYQDPAIWKKPLGELSNLGEQQSYAVGQWFLKRYILKNPFITLHYNASLIYAFSEDRDESLMSAECLMAGFLPPVGNEIWNKKLLWRPTPVHNSPLFLDYAIGRGVYCPRYEQERTKVLFGRYFRTLNKQDKTLLEYLTTETGEKFSNVGQVLPLFNILQVEQNHNLTLPGWTESVYPDILGKIVLEDNILRTKNPLLATLSIGPLFHKIRQQFQDIVEKNPIVGSNDGDIRKFKLYVANNSLIYDTLHALKVPSAGIVPFSASLIFELWETSSGMHYVKLLYRNVPAPNAPIQKLKMSGCKTVKCPFEHFNNTINQYAVDFPQWSALCNVSGTAKTAEKVLPGQPIQLDMRNANL